MLESRTNRIENAWAHHKLEVWKISLDLVTDIYRLTKQFPDDERFGLISQMRRTSVSVVSNIAEGAGKGGQKEFSRYLLISRGALCELETQLRIAARLGFIQEIPDNIDQRVRSVFALLNGLLKRLKL